MYNYYNMYILNTKDSIVELLPGTTPFTFTKMEPVETPIANITTVEPIHVPTLNALVAGMAGDLSTDDIRSLMKLKSTVLSTMEDCFSHHEWNDALYETPSEYGCANIQHYKPNLFGRSFSQTGLLTLRKDLRHMLLNGTLVDVDMVNCAPAITLHMCRQANLKCDHLDLLVNDREAVLQEHMDYCNISRGEAKQLFLSGMFGAKWSHKGKKPTPFFNMFSKEMRGASDQLSIYNPLVTKAIMDQYEKGEVKNLPGKVLAAMTQEFEHRILNEVFMYCVDLGHIQGNVCSLQADGIMLEYGLFNDTLPSCLSAHVQERLGIEMMFEVKPPPEAKYHIDWESKPASSKSPAPMRLLDSKTENNMVLAAETGSDRYLSNLFTYEDFLEQPTIVLKSCCGTGKTYAVAKYLGILQETKDIKVLSIVNRRSLLSAQMKEFERHGVKISSYLDKREFSLEKSGIICINSLMKYAHFPGSFFKTFVLYIDEVCSFLETLSHSNLLTKDIAVINRTLMKMVQNCAKLIVSDHAINSNVFDFLEARQSPDKGEVAPFYVVNKFQLFAGVKATQHKDEQSFLNVMKSMAAVDQPFLAGFDSATKAALYYHEVSACTNLPCILVTDETRYPIPENPSDAWRGTVVFYSPKIETGVDFSVETKQPSFFHITGNSNNPSSMFQQIARTRNMDQLHYFGLPRDKDPEFEYETKECVKETLEDSKKFLNFYACSSYLNDMDELTFSDNTFSKIFCYNEFAFDTVNKDKVEHFKMLLEDNGFDLQENLSEVPLSLPKEKKRDMQEQADSFNDELFESWVAGNKEVEVLAERAEVLNLSDDSVKVSAKEVLQDKYKMEEHMNTVRLLKGKSYIDRKAKDALKHSFVDVGLSNTYCKIKMIHELEAHFGMSHLNVDKLKAQDLHKQTTIVKGFYQAVGKAFHKKVTEPTTGHEVLKLHAGLVNHLVPKLMLSQRGYKDGMNGKMVYTLNEEKVLASLELDKHNNAYMINFDEEVASSVGVSITKVRMELNAKAAEAEEEEVGFHFLMDEEVEEENPLDFGL